MDYPGEVLPIFRRAMDYAWVTAPARVHGFGNNAMLADPGDGARDMRSYVFNFLRTPDASTSGPGTMPKLLGDEPYNDAHPRQRCTLTHTQYEILRRWKDGAFPVPRAAVPDDNIITPWGLDRAALEACVGAPFFPGIEVSWQIRNPALFIEPFRIDPVAKSQYLGEEGQPMLPGHFSRQMALPWQADFRDCKKENAKPNPAAKPGAGDDPRRYGIFGWWPAQRPDDVYLKSQAGNPTGWARPNNAWPDGEKNDSGDPIPSWLEMVKHWSGFGFVVREQDGNPTESERGTELP